MYRAATEPATWSQSHFTFGEKKLGAIVTIATADREEEEKIIKMVEIVAPEIRET